jgi:hypothetical protein
MGIGIAREAYCWIEPGPLVIHEGLSPNDSFGHRATNRVYRGSGSAID